MDRSDYDFQEVERSKSAGARIGGGVIDRWVMGLAYMMAFYKEQWNTMIRSMESGTRLLGFRS